MWGMIAVAQLLDTVRSRMVVTIALLLETACVGTVVSVKWLPYTVQRQLVL